MFGVNKYTKSGIHITFDNGFTVSIQWGYGTYSSNHNPLSAKEILNAAPDAKVVEVAVFRNGGDWVSGWPYQGGDDVEGWLSSDKVLDILIWARDQKEG